MKSPPTILVTRNLSEEETNLAERLGLKVIIEPAIEIHFRNDWLSVQSAVEKAEKPVFVFTSQNGAKAFLRFIAAGIKIPENPMVYSVGNKTANVLRDAGFDPSVPGTHYGAELANKIISDLIEGDKEKKRVTVLHFCGDKRREELRQVLSQSGLNVKDIVVYQTRLKPMNLQEKSPDAILFYSPSAVQSFRNSGGFKQNSLPELFAIGNTTAEELSIASGKHVHVSPETSTDAFLKFTANIMAGINW